MPGNVRILARHHRRLLSTLVVGAFWVSCAEPAAAAGGPADQVGPGSLKQLTIEQLMGIDVTTATRRPEPVATTAAAISVITSNDIRRSGVSTLADALALADGVHVARSSGNQWSIGARGFNGLTPNKTLVMVDGRTANSSIFTGVFWNVVDYPLEDIDRIEVIRGPGAALWGASAVNGVINIITKHSRDTQGAMVRLATGTEDPGQVTARYGGRAGEQTTWRVYGNFAAHDDQQLADGSSSHDGRTRGQAGFRLDGGTSSSTNWMVKGDAFHSSDRFLNRPDGEFTELGLQARYSKPTSPTSRLDLQAYYRREYRRVPLQLTHHIDVFDVETQHASTIGRRHAVIIGGGVRVSADGTHGGSLSLDPDARTLPLTSIFAQDELTVVPERLFLTLGTKFEHTVLSGGALQPNVRARLMLPRTQVLWGAVSRAIRRPTRLDDDLIARDDAGQILLLGSDDFKAESLIATAIGYRIQPLPAASLDVTLFVHEFNDLRSQELPPVGLYPMTFGNTLEGESRGVELAANIQPVPWWRTHVSYTFMNTDIRHKPGSRDITGGVNEANDPNHLFGVRTSLDLPHNLEVDGYLRGVGQLQNLGTPGYVELNARLGWLASPRTEVWLAGTDLLHDAHPELGAATPFRVEFQRAVTLGATFRF